MHDTEKIADIVGSEFFVKAKKKLIGYKSDSWINEAILNLIAVTRVDEDSILIKEGERKTNLYQLIEGNVVLYRKILNETIQKLKEIAPATSKGPVQKQKSIIRTFGGLFKDMMTNENPDRVIKQLELDPSNFQSIKGLAELERLFPSRRSIRANTGLDFGDSQQDIHSSTNFDTSMVVEKPNVRLKGFLSHADDKFYLENQELKSFIDGVILGDRGFFNVHLKSKFTMVTSVCTTLLVLKFGDYQNLAETLSQEFKMKVKKQWKKIRILDYISSRNLIEDLLLRCSPLTISSGDFVYKKGEPVKYVYILIEGNVDYLKDIKISKEVILNLQQRNLGHDLLNRLKLIQQSRNAIKSIKRSIGSPAVIYDLPSADVNEKEFHTHDCKAIGDCLFMRFSLAYFNKYIVSNRQEVINVLTLHIESEKVADSESLQRTFPSIGRVMKEISKQKQREKEEIPLPHAEIERCKSIRTTRKDLISFNQCSSNLKLIRRLSLNTKKGLDHYEFAKISSKELSLFKNVNKSKTIPQVKITPMSEIMMDRQRIERNVKKKEKNDLIKYHKNGKSEQSAKKIDQFFRARNDVSNAGVKPVKFNIDQLVSKNKFFKFGRRTAAFDRDNREMYYDEMIVSLQKFTGCMRDQFAQIQNITSSQNPKEEIMAFRHKHASTMRESAYISNRRPRLSIGGRVNGPIAFSTSTDRLGKSSSSCFKSTAIFSNRLTKTCEHSTKNLTFELSLKLSAKNPRSCINDSSIALATRLSSPGISFTKQRIKMNRRRRFENYHSRDVRVDEDGSSNPVVLKRIK